MFLNWSERSILSIAYFLSNNSTFSTTVYEKTSSMSGIYYAPAFLPKQVSSDIFRRKTIISAVKYFRNTYLWFDLEWHNFLTSFLSFNRLSLEKKKTRFRHDFLQFHGNLSFWGRDSMSVFKVRSVDPDCPLSNIIPKKKEIKYLLGNKSAHRPDIKNDRFKNVFCKYCRIIFSYNLWSFYYYLYTVYLMYF